MLSCSVGDEEERKSMEREARVLLGVVEHILPRIGGQVRTLDLAYGKAVSNEMVRASGGCWFVSLVMCFGLLSSVQVFRMLRQCPNLHYLDLSHTGISDFAFRG